MTILEDVVDEFDETFVVSLQNATDATIVDGVAVVTVSDNDPAPSLAVSDVTVTEADGVAAATVTLTGASSGGVSVDVMTVGGTATAGVDYVSTTATLLWGSDEGGSRQFVVSLVDDLEVEGAEFVILQLANETTTSPSAEGVGLGRGSTILSGDGSAVLKIIDDEAPSLIAIPGLTGWGLIALAGLFGVFLALRIRRPTKAGPQTPLSLGAPLTLV